MAGPRTIRAPLGGGVRCGGWLRHGRVCGLVVLATVACTSEEAPSTDDDPPLMTQPKTAPAAPTPRSQDEGLSDNPRGKFAMPSQEPTLAERRAAAHEQAEASGVLAAFEKAQDREAVTESADDCQRACVHLQRLTVAQLRAEVGASGEFGQSLIKRAEASQASDIRTCNDKCKAGRIKPKCVLGLTSVDQLKPCIITKGN